MVAAATTVKRSTGSVLSRLTHTSDSELSVIAALVQMARLMVEMMAVGIRTYRRYWRCCNYVRCSCASSSCRGVMGQR